MNNHMLEIRFGFQEGIPRMSLRCYQFGNTVVVILHDLVTNPDGETDFTFALGLPMIRSCFLFELARAGRQLEISLISSSLSD